MQAWIRDQDPNQIGTALHDRFTTSHMQRRLITPSTSTQVLLDHLPGDATGQIWDATNPT